MGKHPEIPLRWSVQNKKRRTTYHLKKCELMWEISFSLKQNNRNKKFYLLTLSGRRPLLTAPVDCVTMLSYSFLCLNSIKWAWFSPKTVFLFEKLLFVSFVPFSLLKQVEALLELYVNFATWPGILLNPLILLKWWHFNFEVWLCYFISFLGPLGLSVFWEILYFGKLFRFWPVW